MPPYHCEFNAIETVWFQCKRFYGAHREEFGYGNQQVLSTWQRALENVSLENWKSYIAHTNKVIDEWWTFQVQLHDTSEKAFGASLYIRKTDIHHNHSVLKKLTLPRLKLCGAVLLILV